MLAIVLLLSVCARVDAQSLADAARQAEEQRKSNTQPSIQIVQEPAQGFEEIRLDKILVDSYANARVGMARLWHRNRPLYERVRDSGKSLTRYRDFIKVLDDEPAIVESIKFYGFTPETLVLTQLTLRRADRRTEGGIGRQRDVERENTAFMGQHKTYVNLLRNRWMNEEAGVVDMARSSLLVARSAVIAGLALSMARSSTGQSLADAARAAEERRKTNESRPGPVITLSKVTDPWLTKEQVTRYSNARLALARLLWRDDGLDQRLRAATATVRQGRELIPILADEPRVAAAFEFNGITTSDYVRVQMAIERARAQREGWKPKSSDPQDVVYTNMRFLAENEVWFRQLVELWAREEGGKTISVGEGQF